jgi:hypothetical protein
MAHHKTSNAWLLLVLLPGLAGVCVFGYAALGDWSHLKATYAVYERVSTNSTSDMKAVFIAEANQNIHRINLFADGVWTLLSAILAAIGLHGLCQKKANS